MFSCVGSTVSPIGFQLAILSEVLIWSDYDAFKKFFDCGKMYMTFAILIILKCALSSVAFLKCALSSVALSISTVLGSGHHHPSVELFSP